MDSGTGITGGGSGYAVILAHAGGLLSGTELGLVTLKRVGLFFFPIKHSTHTFLKGPLYKTGAIGIFYFPHVTSRITHWHAPSDGLNALSYSPSRSSITNSHDPGIVAVLARV